MTRVKRTSATASSCNLASDRLQAPSRINGLRRLRPTDRRLYPGRGQRAEFALVVPSHPWSAFNA